MTRRLAAVGLGLMVLMASGLFAAPEALASAGNCVSSGSNRYHAGEVVSPSTARGGTAIVQHVEPALCTFTGSSYPTLSTSWVALTAISPTDTYNDDIYQVGFLKCQTTWSACPTNTSNYVYAYGHEASAACGARVSPGAVFLGASGTGTHTYAVYRHSSESGYDYSVYIAGAEKNIRSQSALETCWPGGPRQVKWLNEVANLNDQSGGTTADKEDWTYVQYLNGGTWTNANFLPTCQLHNLATQGCTGSGSTFVTWDTRL